MIRLAAGGDSCPIMSYLIIIGIFTSLVPHTWGSYKIGVLSTIYSKWIGFYSLNNSIEIVNVNFSSFNSMNDLKKSIEYLNSYNLSALIHSYDPDLEVLASNLRLPYYVIDDTEVFDNYLASNVLSPYTTVFHVNICLRNVMRAIEILFNELKADFVHLIHSFHTLPSKFIKEVSAASVLFTKINDDRSTLDSSLLQSLKLIHKEKKKPFTAILLNNQDALIREILNDGLYTGLLRNRNPWMVVSLNLDHSILLDFRSTGAHLMTFQLETNSTFKSIHELQNNLFEDAVNHFLSSTSTFGEDSIQSVARTSLVNGKTGVVQFDSHRRRTNFTIKLLSTEKEAETMLQIGRFKVTEIGVELQKDSSFNTNNIRVAVFKKKPYLFESKSEKAGFVHDLINILHSIHSESINITYVYPSNCFGECGVQDLLHLLASGEADFLPVPIFNYNIDERVSLSFPILINGIDILISKDENKLSFGLFLMPFTFNTWLSVVIAFFLMGIALYFISIFVSIRSKHFSNSNNEDYSRNDIPTSFTYSLFVILSALSVAKLDVGFSHSVHRLLLLVVWLFSLLVVCSYAANMLSFLVKPDSSLPFPNLKALLNDNGDYKWAFINNSDIALKASLSINSQLFQLFNIARTNWPHEMLINGRNKAIERMRRDPYLVVIDDHMNNQHLRNSHCFLRKEHNIELTENVYFGIRKDWKGSSGLRSLLEKVHTKGLINNLHITWFHSGSCPKRQLLGVNAKPLKLHQLAGLFMATVSGICLSFIVLGLEHLYERLKRIYRHQIKISISLKFGEEYNSTVEEIGLNGVWLKIEGRPNKYFLPNSVIHQDHLKIYSARDMGLRKGDNVKVKYFGKEPWMRTKRFILTGR